uniref:Uncharacterized protein n=1 Tax=Spiroplasma kunkelii CR2-3x TaxID=273035 RepID=Q5VCB5_SPIKU|nr:hypothetical protein SKUN_p0075 [Spiroplasma kunkelii CR2-3x]
MRCFYFLVNYLYIFIICYIMNLLATRLLEQLKTETQEFSK